MRKILAYAALIMFFCLTIFSAAEAEAKAEFKSITIQKINDENFVIEAEFKGKLEEKDIKLSSIGAQFLLLDIDNATPGRISKVSGVNNSAKDFVENANIFINSTKKNNPSTRMMFSFAENIDEGAVNVSIWSWETNSSFKKRYTPSQPPSFPPPVFPLSISSSEIS